MNARKALLIAVAVGALVAVSGLQSGLNRSREALGLTRTGVLSNAPPVLAFTTVALGGFRGLIANALWIRTSELQEEGRYFEAVQLADWITKLQPHFSTVWVHQAWNMSYNISVKFPNPEDRWLWVQRGIELLRDQGLTYNPHDMGIHEELARHFHHKMGAFLDDAHLTYKAHWAELMQAALGGGRPDYPTLLDPQTDAQREQVRELVESYKLDPVLMKEVDDTYGPLEWRLPETHAIYWAWRGLKVAKGEGDILKLRRLIFQPMLTAFQRGRLVTNQFTREIDLGPNLALIPNVSKAYLDQIAAEPAQDDKDHFGKAHRNFLLNAAYFLFTYGRQAEAKRWFDYVRQNYTKTGVPDDWSVEQFALSRIGEDINETSMDRVRAMVEGMLTSGYFNLALGEEDHGAALLDMAAKVHRNYMTRVAVNQGTLKRVPLPPLDQIRQEILRQMLAPDPDTSIEFQAALRTRLNLPADFAITPATNAPGFKPPAIHTNAPGATPRPL